MSLQNRFALSIAIAASVLLLAAGSLHADDGTLDIGSRRELFVDRYLIERLNYATSAAGSIRVEIQDAEGKPVPEYTAADCVEILGNRLAWPVKWKGGGNLSSLAGQGGAPAVRHEGRGSLRATIYAVTE